MKLVCGVSSVGGCTYHSAEGVCLYPSQTAGHPWVVVCLSGTLVLKPHSWH